MAVYHATGLNDNYVYLNTGQETLPNGLVGADQWSLHTSPHLWSLYTEPPGYFPIQNSQLTSLI